MSLQTITQKIRAAIRRGGFSELSRIAGNSIYTHLSPQGRQWRKQVRRCDVEFDRECGVDTAGFISQWDIGPVVDRETGCHYQGTDVSEFRRVLDALTLEHSKYTFVDYGSGKGRATIAAEYSFCAVVGVEHGVNLHTTAERNITIDRGPRRVLSTFRSILGDAATFSPPPGSLLVHINNPFAKSVLERV